MFSISADSHVTEPGDCYVDRIDPRFRDRAPVAADDDTMGAVMVIDGGYRVPYGMVAAAGRPAEKIGPFVHVGWDELHRGAMPFGAAHVRGVVAGGDDLTGAESFIRFGDVNLSAPGDLVFCDGDTLHDEFAAPPNGIYAVFPQRKHLPLRVRLWIDFLKHTYGDPAYWQGAAK